MKEEIKLTAESIFLREIVNSDIEHVFRGLSHPAVIKYYGVSFNSLEETKTQMKWFADDKQKWFAICSLDSQIFYGAGGLNDICLKHRKAEIGLWLLREYWGQGIMKQAMQLITIYGFDQLNLHRIEGFVDADNNNCRRAMSKLDFEFEGTMKECEFKTDRYVSIDIYARIRNPRK
jgi:ribosomal-protein-alanine N-acetyltransferase